MTEAVYCSFDGAQPIACSNWTIREPVRGRWTADLVMRSPLPPPAQGASVSLSSGRWRGTAAQVTALGASLFVHVVGGANCLAKATEAKQYLNGSARAAVLSDLCSAAGETAGADAASVANWRVRGEALEIELRRLSRDWFIAPDGSVGLTREARTADAPGNALAAVGDGITYACEDILPYAGASVNGVVIECAIIRPNFATLFPLRPVAVEGPSIVAGTILSLSNGRAAIALDNGENLDDVPLFCAAGYVPEGASQVRVLVLDVADASNTIAITGVDGRIDGLTLGNASDVGYLLRSGEAVSIQGLISGAPGAAVTSPPGAVTITIDPVREPVPGPPGNGHSRTKG